MGLEINLISFISLILTNKKCNTIEASIIYFIIQSFASIIFLVSILIYRIKIYLNFFIFKFSYKTIIAALLTKIGRSPFHFWLPLIIERLNWVRNYLIITWQKLGPLILIYNNLDQKFLITFVILSSITGALGGFNQTSIKKLIAFSSINQIRWLLISLIISKFLLKIYYLFYFYISFNALIIFNLFNLTSINQLYTSKFLNKSIIIFIFFNIFSIGGLPPFLGFLPKIIIIINLNNNIIIIILIVFTLITLYYYFRLIYSILLLKYYKNYTYFLKNNNKNKININILIYFSYIINIFLLIFLLT